MVHKGKQKMKCVKLGDKVSRLTDEMAATRIAKGWKYCSKTEFKKTTDKEVIHKVVNTKSDKPKKVKKQRPQKDDAVDAMINKKN
jgi:hypothetical protein